MFMPPIGKMFQSDSITGSFLHKTCAIILIGLLSVICCIQKWLQLYGYERCVRFRADSFVNLILAGHQKGDSNIFWPASVISF
jgi:hypothetical protein